MVRASIAFLLGLQLLLDHLPSLWNWSHHVCTQHKAQVFPVVVFNEKSAGGGRAFTVETRNKDTSQSIILYSLERINQVKPLQMVDYFPSSKAWLRTARGSTQGKQHVGKTYVPSRELRTLKTRRYEPTNHDFYVQASSASNKTTINYESIHERETPFQITHLHRVTTVKHLDGEGGSALVWSGVQSMKLYPIACCSSMPLLEPYNVTCLKLLLQWFLYPSKRVALYQQQAAFRHECYNPNPIISVNKKLYPWSIMQ